MVNGVFLPAEIWDTVMSYLDPLTVLQLQMVNTHFNRICMRERYWARWACRIPCSFEMGVQAGKPWPREVPRCSINFGGRHHGHGRLRQHPGPFPFFTQAHMVSCETSWLSSVTWVRVIRIDVPMRVRRHKCLRSRVFHYLSFVIEMIRKWFLTGNHEWKTEPLRTLDEWYMGETNLLPPDKKFALTGHSLSILKTVRMLHVMQKWCYWAACTRKPSGDRPTVKLLREAQFLFNSKYGELWRPFLSLNIFLTTANDGEPVGKDSLLACNLFDRDQENG